MVYKHCSGLICQEVGEELLVYHSPSQQVHCLDGRAAEIFLSCEKSGSFPADGEEIGRRLLELGLLEVVGEQVERRAFLVQLGQTAAAAGIVSLGVPLPAAAASCSDVACSMSGLPVCSPCNPPGCTGIVVRSYFMGLSADSQGGVFCASGEGVGTMSACVGLTHVVRSDCTQAKTELVSLAGQGRYLCCGNVGASCASPNQCSANNAAWLGTACCSGGTCQSNGSCSGGS